MSNPVFWSVFVSDEPKGEVFKQPKSRRWVWLRPNGGKEIYGPGSTIEDVRDHIGRLCNVWGNAVELRKNKKDKS